MYQTKQLFKACMILVLGGTLFACGGGGGDSGGNDKVQPTLTSLWEYHFNGCGLNCHSPDAADGTENGPDLTTKENFYNNLVGKNAVDDFGSWLKNSNCNAVDFITPGNANESSLAAAMLQNVSDQLSAAYSCTTSYNIHVVNRVAISDQEIANALVSWINSGAQNN